MRIEQIIKERKREHFYKFYQDLGYDDKTAAALALYTYGERRLKSFSIDDFCEAISNGKEYPTSRQVVSNDRIYGFMPTFSPGPAVSKFRTVAEDIDDDADDDFDDSIEDFVETECSIMAAPKACSAPGRPLGTGSPKNAVYEAAESLAAPSLSRNTGAFDLAALHGFATDEYEAIEEKNARGTAAEPTSTFRMTTNTASAGVVLNQLRNGREIDKSMVRIEEMLNYFRYDSEIPKDEMFNISCEIMDSGKDRKYLYINVQGREEVKEKQNVVLLLDVSGSMDSNAEVTQAAIAAIVSKLGNGDKFSLVTYSSTDSVELEAFTVKGAEDRKRVIEKVLTLMIFGGTWGSKGIETAYEIGKRNFIEGGNNQVILITDGDLNFGITDKGGLEELIEFRKKDNLFLSVIGTGLWNYKDDKLETLCRHGNGVYRVVNDLKDVKKSIDEEYASLVNVIAKDVKAQVEFNPEKVGSYRLLGFENREIAREDFTNDKVISEPFGSGGYGVAVYELTMKTGSEPVDSGLKYSRIVTTGSSELGTVKVRYKEPLEDVSHEIEKVIESPDASYTDNLRLAYIVYVCAEKLRGSDKIGKEELKLAEKLYKELGDAARERNAADLFKLEGILEKSEGELKIGILKKIFPW